MVDVLRDWKPPLLVVMDHSDVWHDVKAASPATIFVGRFNQEYEPDLGRLDVDPLEAARTHCDRVLPWAERMGDTYSFWQGLNEPELLSSDAVGRYAEFDAERARIMDQHGFRVIVGSFAVGNPARLGWWTQFLPALEAARQFNGALALHEYAWPSLDRQWAWYSLRHRKVYEGEPRHEWAGLPEHLRATPLLITECGLDGAIVQSLRPRGWQVLYGDDPGRYLEQLAWYDGEIQKDPYVIAAAVYCCCAADDPNWGTYNIWPEIVQELAQHAAPVYRLEQPPVSELPEEALFELVVERLDQIIDMLKRPS
jgi:hypothetical protein